MYKHFQSRIPEIQVLGFRRTLSYYLYTLPTNTEMKHSTILFKPTFQEHETTKKSGDLRSSLLNQWNQSYPIITHRLKKLLLPLCRRWVLIWMVHRFFFSKWCESPYESVYRWDSHFHFVASKNYHIFQSWGVLAFFFLGFTCNGLSL